MATGQSDTRFELLLTLKFFIIPHYLCELGMGQPNGFRKTTNFALVYFSWGIPFPIVIIIVIEKQLRQFHPTSKHTCHQGNQSHQPHDPQLPVYGI